MRYIPLIKLHVTSLHTFQLGSRPKSLILSGPSRLGKTVWARSLGKHIYWNTYYSVDEWDDSAEYIIVDDVPWENFSRIHKAILGCQLTFVLTDKYRGKKTIKNWGRPCIFLCNEDNDPFTKAGDYHIIQWLRENCVKVEITNKLY